MITIKLPYTTSQEHTYYIALLQRQQSCIVRYAYNRLQDGIGQTDIRAKVKSLNNIEKCDSWFVQSAIYDAMSMHARDKDASYVRIFGGKITANKRAAGKISNEQIKAARLQPISSVGEAAQSGNRKFRLDMENNCVIFKPNKTTHIKLALPKLKRELRNKLLWLQNKSILRECPYTVKITHGYIHISFEYDNSYKKVNTSNKFFAGIDLNPSAIGFTVLDKTGVVHHAKAYDLYRLHTKLGVTSTDPKQKAQNAKLKHEVIHICKDIVEYCIQNNIAHLVLEALKLAPKQHNKGKVFNKLVNNKWVRSLIVQQITKRCALAGVNLHTIHPAYSSIIGNLTYQIYDPCAAAAEMARRCIEIVCSSTDKKKRYSLPPVTKKVDDLLNHWKKEANPTTYTDWKEIGAFLKNSKVRYRVPLPATAKSYRFICRKSGVVCHLIK